MEKTIMNGYVYELLGGVITVQEEREVVFKYYPTTPPYSSHVIK
ncbi:hypothetical protein [Enterobacter cloacae]